MSSAAVSYVKPDVFDLIPALPEAGSDLAERIIFVLVFVVAGVAVQALLWALRRWVLYRQTGTS